MCVMLCCVGVVLCWCAVCVCVVCGAARSKKKRGTMPPCVDSKRLRVYRQQVHMYKTCGLKSAAAIHGVPSIRGLSDAVW